KTKAAVVDKLRDLHAQLDKGVTPKPGYTHYTVRQAAADWLAHGLEGRSPKTITKNHNVLAPILAVIGARKLRELTADDVRQARAEGRPPPGRAHARLHHAQLARGDPHRRSPRPALVPRRPRRRPGRPAAAAPAHRRVAVGPRPRRHQDRAIPPHPRPPRSRRP